MPIYKQKGSECWYVDIKTPSGPRIRRSTGTTDERQAQEYHDKLKYEAWRTEKFGEQPDRLWDDAVRRFLLEKADKRTIGHDKRMLSWSAPYLWGKPLSAIDRNMIEHLIEARRAGKVKRTENGVSNATINRHMEAIQRVLNCAVSWEWLGKVPPIRHLKESEGRLRWLTEVEASTLLHCLPDHTRAMADFTLCTGLRENNVLDLTWSQVDMARQVAWVHPDQSKNGKAISIPLNENAMKILTARKGINDTYVFAYNGVPMTKASSHSWYRGLKKAGLKGQFTWHGLRHTWASWHVMNGTPLEVLQKLGGWSSLSMVMRYAHLSPGHLAQYANNAKPTT